MRRLRVSSERAALVYHPTKGYRRVSFKRLAARAKMQRMLGLAVANATS